MYSYPYTIVITVGNDFRLSLTGARKLFTLGPNVPRFCFAVTAIDDGLIEGPERFAIHLNAFPLRFVLLRDQDAEITIIDSEFISMH